jgi:glyoxalase family protein
MKSLINGIHHITSCVSGAQEDIDFWTEIIGLRMIKQTVLFDGAASIYHLYYANADAEPGSVMTCFPFKQAGVYGRKGTGQIKTAGYSVPGSSLDFWLKRFDKYKVEHSPIKQRFGQKLIHFCHPSGLEFEMIGDDSDKRKPWTTAEISADVGVRGFHSLCLSLREVAESERYMIEGLGFRKTGEEGPYTRFEVQDGGAKKTVDFLHEPDVPQGSWTFGVGTPHHVAFDVSNADDQKKLKDYLEGLGYTDVSESKDRNYFRSIYTRMPGGVLFEMAYSIGFEVDELKDKLGHQMLLPPWFESRRAEILAPLEPITPPAYCREA